MPFIRSISGLRATLGDGLLPSLIACYAVAFAKTIHGNKIVVGRDGRPSGLWIEDIVKGALVASGFEVRLIGVVPTPTVQLEVEFSDAAGGIAITASHNPGQWNGLKFINKDGVFLDGDENQKLWDLVDKKNMLLPEENYFYEAIHDFDALQRHIEKIHQIQIISTNLNLIKKNNFKAVVDAVNASGSIIVPELLRSLGCDVIDLFCDGSGLFPHMPEPLPQNLNKLAETVKAVNAHIGIAVDPDADRLVLIDENGIAVSEEKTIALCVQSVLMQSVAKSCIVVNLSTSSMAELVSQKYGFATHRAPVGEINVVKLMKQTDALIGGEGSGGVILPECHYGRDSLVGISLILNLMACTGKSISELSSDLPKLSMIKLKKEFTGKLDTLIIKIKEKYKDYQISTIDGIRVDLKPGKWFQLRASNTEPIIRVIAESDSEIESRNLANSILEMVI